MSTSIEPLKISRIDIATTISEPIQVTDDYQFFINSYTELFIIEPKYPNFHKIIKLDTNQRRKLIPKELFSTVQSFHRGDVDKLPLGRFNKVIFKDGDEDVTTNFNINEPIIVHHELSPIFIESRQNILGLLYNTGEVLLFQRENFTKDVYFTKLIVFEVLLSHYNYNVVPDSNDVVVTKDEFRNLKVNYFTFGFVDEVLLLTIVNHNNKILIFELKRESFETRFIRQIEMDKKVIKVRWFGNKLIVQGLDNSVYLETRQILKPDRFQLSQLHHDEYFITTCTNKMILFDENEVLSFETGNYNQCSSIVTGNNPSTIIIILSFENGKIQTVEFDKREKTFKVVNNDIEFTKFFNKINYSFQLERSNDNLLSKEPKITIQSMNKMANDLIAITYKVVPKDEIYYRSPAFLESTLQFIKLSKPIDESLDKLSTSNARLTKYLFDNVENIPVMNSVMTEKREITIAKFNEDLLSYINKFNFRTDIKSFEIKNTLRQTIKESFLNNQDIKNLQFDYILLNFMKDAILEDDIHDKITNYQIKIEAAIVCYLQKLILSYFSQVSDPYDKYILITMKNELEKHGINFPYQDSTEITIKTKFFNETFKVSTSDIEKTPLAKSISGHGFAKCKLTNLPLLRMVNKMDELQKFRYISKINANTELSNISKYINFCYITGNKTFEIK